MKLMAQCPLPGVPSRWLQVPGRRPQPCYGSSR